MTRPGPFQPVADPLNPLLCTNRGSTGHIIGIDMIFEDYSFTGSLRLNEVMRKRSYLKKEWCIRIIENPLRVEPQEHNRFRFWGAVTELEGRMEYG